jgi:hypothetical protein
LIFRARTISWRWVFGVFFNRRHLFDQPERPSSHFLNRDGLFVAEFSEMLTDKSDFPG